MRRRTGATRIFDGAKRAMARATQSSVRQRHAHFLMGRNKSDGKGNPVEGPDHTGGSAYPGDQNGQRDRGSCGLAPFMRQRKKTDGKSTQIFGADHPGGPVLSVRFPRACGTSAPRLQSETHGPVCMYLTPLRSAPGERLAKQEQVPAQRSCPTGSGTISGWKSLASLSPCFAMR